MALAFIARLRAELREYVPRGMTLVVTCTAPIRKDSKTAAALVEMVANALARRPDRLELKETIYENRVRVRMVKRGSTDRVQGFVHNPDVDPEAFLT